MNIFLQSYEAYGHVIFNMKNDKNGYSNKIAFNLP